MCDDDTEAENETYLQQTGVTRRAWGVGASATVAGIAAAAAAGLGACATKEVQGPASAAETQPSSETPTEPAPTPQAAAGEAKVSGRRVAIETPDGNAEAFFVAPDEGAHPGIVIWPDVAGLRGAFETMATRLATAGYAVLAVNCYYRSSKLPILTEFSEWRSDEGKAKIKPMREALTPEGIAKDGAAFVAWLDAQPQVDTARKIGTMGYCMGGPFTFRTAAAVPQRVGAIASFHGGGLVREGPDSPHALLAKMQAAALICVARNDDERAPQDKSTLQKAADEAKLSAEIEVYPAQHGWCVVDSPVYDEAQAERAWARTLATFEQHL